MYEKLPRVGVRFVVPTAFNGPAFGGGAFYQAGARVTLAREIAERLVRSGAAVLDSENVNAVYDTAPQPDGARG